MKIKSVIFLLFAVLFMISACSGVEQSYPITINQEDGTIITLEKDGSMTIEQANGLIITRDKDGTMTSKMGEYLTTIRPEDGAINVKYLPETSHATVTTYNQKTSSTRIMSEEKAMEITEGKMVYLPEYDYVDSYYGAYRACLTPSGKLIYIPEWEFSKLSGQTDFDIRGGIAYEFFISTDTYTEKNSVSISTVISDETALKYDLFLEYRSVDEDNYDFVCYPIVSSGKVVFDMGLTLDNADFTDYDVTYTISGDGNISTDDPLILTAKIGQTVYIEDQSRTYPFHENYRWQISAEVKDNDGNVVYTEEFTAYESYKSDHYDYGNTYYITKGHQM